MRGAVYQFDGWTIDYDFRTAIKAGKSVSLAPKELDVLVFLIENMGKMAYRDDLMLHVWGENIPADHTLDHMIYRLRTLLKTDAIKSVNKRGYYVHGRYYIEPPA